jgi:hypothetical protein
MGGNGRHGAGTVCKAIECGALAQQYCDIVIRLLINRQQLRNMQHTRVIPVANIIKLKALMPAPVVIACLKY